MPGWVIFASAFGYLLLLFAVASYGDRRRAGRFGVPKRGRPVVYALSLAIYCTSWTYFGGVGLAAQRGLEFAGIYIGPILVFTLGMPVLRRIIELAKAEKLTSVADFIAARYGKNSAVATIVALISLVGAIPYIALQLKAISSAVAAMVNSVGLWDRHRQSLLPRPAAARHACRLPASPIMFGTRHTDATEHQDGLILAIAMESLVKLLAISRSASASSTSCSTGPPISGSWRRGNAPAQAALAYQTPISRWITLIAAVRLCDHHAAAAVPCHGGREPHREANSASAGFLFPLYLVAINLFVLPIAMGGPDPVRRQRATPTSTCCHCRSPPTCLWSR